MLIDWFTVAAQIVNFLVLVIVLKLVLYDRVVAAMDAREEGIADRIASAEVREEAADAEAESYRARRRELEARSERMLGDAEAQATERRNELIEEARVHVDSLRSGWEDGLRRDRAHFLEEIRHRAGEGVCTVSRRALADLADADLESQLVHVAVKRLRDESDGLRPLADEHHDGAAPVIVRSAFPLADEAADAVTAAVIEQLGCDTDEIEMTRDPELICGLEIRVGGWSVGWSVDGYLDTVVAEFDALLPRAADATAGRAGADGAGSGTTP